MSLFLPTTWSLPRTHSAPLECFGRSSGTGSQRKPKQTWSVIIHNRTKVFCSCGTHVFKNVPSFSKDKLFPWKEVYNRKTERQGKHECAEGFVEPAGRVWFDASVRPSSVQHHTEWWSRSKPSMWGLFRNRLHHPVCLLWCRIAQTELEMDFTKNTTSYFWFININYFNR